MKDRLIETASKNPVNKTASLVIRVGVHYEPKKGLNSYDSEVPLPVHPMKECNIVGLRAGLLVVLGYSANKDYLCVARCNCGIYTLRQPKAMKNPKNFDACDRCRHVAHLKRKDLWFNSGRNVPIEDCF